MKEQYEEAQGYLYAEPLPAVAYEAYLQGRRLGLPSACALENLPDRGRGIAASAQTPVMRRKLRRG